MNPILLITIGVAAWLIFAKKAAVQNLQYYIASVSANMDGITPVLTVQLAIQNGSGEAFYINSIVGTIKANGYTIGTVSSFAQMPIAAASQTVYPVNVRLSPVAIAMDVFNQVTNHNGIGQTITFEGTINASGVVAPINLSYKVA